MRKFNAVILVVISILIISACGVVNKQKEVDTVTEEFFITAFVDDGYVRGELTTGTGEGIYYTKKALLDAGADHIKFGDKVQVTWTKYDYDNELWDNIYEVKNVK